jgi:hypothetical protein
MPRIPARRTSVISKTPAKKRRDPSLEYDRVNQPGPNDHERWLPIPGWPHYEVSDWGRVRSYRGGPAGKFGGQGKRGIRSTPVLIWGDLTIWGRRSITLVRSLPDGTNERRVIGVHILVLLAFVGPCPEGCEACHNPDHNPLNNRLENLRWDTRRANAIDRLKHGRNQYAKLTEDDIPEIWRRLVAGESQVEIGRDFGVSGQTICSIKGGKTWTHITSKLPGWPLMPIDRDDRKPVYVPSRYTRTDKEIWRLVPGYPAFRVSNRGRIQSRWKVETGHDGRFVRWTSDGEWHDRALAKGRDGHLIFSVPLAPGRTTTLRVHACLLCAFAGPCPTGMIGCHGDGNPENNHAANLRWDTHSSNARDRVKHAKQRLEEKNG